MTNLSEKELSMLNDSLAEEERLVKTYNMLAEQTQDEEIRQKFMQISKQHQGHFNELYSLLG